MEELEKALTELLAGTATKDDFMDVFVLLNILPADRVDHTYFSGIAALAERLLYNKFLLDSALIMKQSCLVVIEK